MNIDKLHFAQLLGRNIAAHRQKQGLTQEQLAEKMDLGNEAISRIERGVTMPSLMRLFEFANIFHCEVSELISQVAEKEEVEYLALLLQGLSQPDKQFVIATIQHLVDYLKSKA